MVPIGGAAAFLLAMALGGNAWPVLAPPARDDRILVVAPHVDDESIAAAGFLSDAIRSGAEVFVVYVTAGDCNRTTAALERRTFRPGPSAFLQEGEARLREGATALSMLGIGEDRTFVLGYPDRGLLLMWNHPEDTIVAPGTRRSSVPYGTAVSPGAPYRIANLERDLGAVVRRVAPTIVIAPVDFDRHPDHRVTAWAAARVVPPSAKWLGYLIHAPDFPEVPILDPRASLMPPRRERRHAWCVYPLSPECARQKHRVLERYRSQRIDPAMFLLTDAFVRANELFVQGRPAA